MTQLPDSRPVAGVPKGTISAQPEGASWHLTTHPRLQVKGSTVGPAHPEYAKTMFHLGEVRGRRD